MTRSRYRSPAGRAAIERHHAAALDRIRPAPRARVVRTGAGPTHLLEVGPPAGRPVLVLGGGNFLTPTCLGWFASLADQYLLIAPDIVGQPGRSAPTRPSPRGDGHARWLVDVLDELGVTALPLIGVSYGAGLALRLMGHAPARVERAGLVAPAGLVSGPLRPQLTRVVWPMLRYRMAPDEHRLRAATRPLLSEEDELLSRQIGAVYRHVRLDTRLPRRATAAELAPAACPVLIFTGTDDIFFPAADVERRAREIVPVLADVAVLPATRHIPSHRDFVAIGERLRSFLGDAADPPGPAAAERSGGRARHPAGPADPQRRRQPPPFGTATSVAAPDRRAP